ncbi:hypothetical protein PBRA_003311 [Plasmodiophora brassicae]|uniref:Uncharacterized protein n=1 Tax=Plasmodiophora brassicae TaxID=37360 RepID=A0A0G4J8N4_PLABS|nr:hypothetical protein PBRA_003311 [Plasmodiophora brassicae]
MAFCATVGPYAPCDETNFTGSVEDDKDQTMVAVTAVVFVAAWASAASASVKDIRDLTLAVELRDGDAVQAILSERVGCFPVSVLRSAVHHAVEKGDGDLIGILCRHIGSMDDLDVGQGGQPTIHLVIQKHDLRLLQRFLALLPRIDLHDGNGITAMHVVAAEPNVHKFASILLRNGFSDVNRMAFFDGVHGVTALHIASQRGRGQVVDILLGEARHLVDVNLVDELGRSALHLAIQAGQVPIAKALVSAGVDCFVSDKFGTTAYGLAGGRMPSILRLMKVVTKMRTKVRDASPGNQICNAERRSKGEERRTESPKELGRDPAPQHIVPGVVVNDDIISAGIGERLLGLDRWEAFALNADGIGDSARRTMLSAIRDLRRRYRELVGMPELDLAESRYEVGRVPLPRVVHQQ